MKMMIKRTALVAITLVLAVGVLLISIDKTVSPTKAASTLSFTVEPASTSPDLAGKESLQSSQVDYFLPYPGILPDSPLYKIKMVRDRIWLWLTRQPSKKLDLLLLFADKRIGAGEILIKGNKVALGVSTLTKGEKYWERAVGEVNRLSAEKRMGAKEKLIKASLKYQEILENLLLRVSAEEKTELEKILNSLKSLREQLANFQ